MTEYIIEFAEYLIPTHPRKIREEIVRCRDCIYYSGEDSAVYPRWCMAMNADGIEPDGFCAWGERK